LDARLLLESERLRPEVGPAIVLAASALETRIDRLLQQGAEQAGGETLALWSWLSDRSQWWREPSFSEKLSDMLAALSGRSLRDDTTLWEAFKNIRDARNKYVHEGVARIDNDQVTTEAATNLVAKARLILDWLERELPDEAKRPSFEGTHKFEIRLPLSAPQLEEDQS